MRKINVRFLDVLGSRGGYNYIISGMMYSTSCWNYRLSQNRRYNKESGKKQREGGKVVHEKNNITQTHWKGLEGRWYIFLQVQYMSFFVFVSLWKGNIDPVIRKLKRSKSFMIHL